MKFRSIFVTGTDTAVGKTTVACGIAAALSRQLTVGVFKPSETGCSPTADGRLRPEDAVRLQFFSNCRLDLQTICPYPLRLPLAPLVAAAEEQRRIDVEKITRCHHAIAAAHDITLIEGAGGLLVPVAPALTFADVAAHLDAGLIVVVASRLGAINHALLTMRHAHCLGLRVLGYVVNFCTAGTDIAATTNIAVLADWLGPPLGVVPYLGEVAMTDASRTRLADLFTAQIRLAALMEMIGDRPNTPSH